MPAPYRLFYVTTWSITPGKMPEAMAWYQKGVGVWQRLAGVTSVQGYATQFGLAPAEGIEIWTEIEDYAVLDSWDRIEGALRQAWLDLNEMAKECVVAGPARLMGDMAGSVPNELGGELSPAAPQA